MKGKLSKILHLFSPLGSFHLHIPEKHKKWKIVEVGNINEPIPLPLIFITVFYLKKILQKIVQRQYPEYWLVHVLLICCKSVSEKNFSLDGQTWCLVNMYKSGMYK